jgi:hypothetical protein
VDQIIATEILQIVKCLKKQVAALDRELERACYPVGECSLRKALWMVVLQLVRRNPWLRQYYERLRTAGKPGKVAIIAAMRKLLVAA